MHSAVLILPLSLREAGDLIGAAMGWGPVSYSIPVGAEGAGVATHIALRADVTPAFIAMIAAAREGTYPDGLPGAVLGPVVAALIADFAPDPTDPARPALWGEAHLDAVLTAHGLVRLT